MYTVKVFVFLAFIWEKSSSTAQYFVGRYRPHWDSRNSLISDLFFGKHPLTTDELVFDDYPRVIVITYPADYSDNMYCDSVDEESNDHGHLSHNHLFAEAEKFS